MELAAIAALMGDGSRATMLLALLDGRALTATELSSGAGILPQTASSHLAKLVNGGLLEVESQGRHRYFRLASPEVAHAVEALSVVAANQKTPPTAQKPEGIRFARTCYDHLAGWGCKLRRRWWDGVF